jgi:hypothetical protein
MDDDSRTAELERRCANAEVESALLKKTLDDRVAEVCVCA